MISVTEAARHVIAHFPAIGSESCPLVDAHGRVLREDITADRDHPPYNRVTMDGIAVSLERGGVARGRFVIEAVQKAGEPQKSLKDPGGCLEVMTGAALPVGTDSVIRVEDLDIADGAATLRDGTEVSIGQYVHRQASDLRQGAVIVKSGIRLLAPQIAVAASEGMKTLLVARRPSVAIVSTGDELVDVGETPLPHQIRRSNPYAIRAALSQRQLHDIQIHHVNDDLDGLRVLLGEVLQRVEVLVITGGVSMGKFDFVPEVLRELGVAQVFHKVRQRPGKPLWFGRGPSGQAVFGLPGNPVSAVVCAYRYLIPALDIAMGLPSAQESAVLAETVHFRSPLTYFLPVRLKWSGSGQLEAVPAPTNGSGDLGALTHSDGFVELDAERDDFSAGSVAPVYRWSG
ncbi:MAG: molybdopterin molybdotransferase MoeA [Candidatus Hydrogenedentes bacterium]|nr:molybdopterin molybdotransferase MoeA [Candidatus Hydrogenedentota bacterium]